MSPTDEKDNFALAPRPASAVEHAAPATRRLLSGMVADTLALASKETSKPAKARFRIGDYEWCEPDYRATLVPARKGFQERTVLAGAGDIRNLGFLLARGVRIGSIGNTVVSSWDIFALERGTHRLQGKYKAAARHRWLAELHRLQSADLSKPENKFGLAMKLKELRGDSEARERSFHLFMSAALGEHGPAMEQVGISYFDGAGVSRNRAEAYKWFSLAARKGCSDSADFVSFINPVGFTKEEIHEGRRKLAEYD